MSTIPEIQEHFKSLLEKHKLLHGRSCYWLTDPVTNQERVICYCSAEKFNTLLDAIKKEI